jgi:hypothetical protein
MDVEPWQEPVYAPTQLPRPMPDGNVWVGACGFCKALVLDTGGHTQWHLLLYGALAVLRDERRGL